MAKKTSLEYVIDGYVNSGFYKAIKGASNAIARAGNATKGLNSLQRQSAAAARRAAAGEGLLRNGLLGTVVGMGAAYVGTEKLIEGYKSVMEETEGAIRAQTRLRTLMLNNKGVTMANVRAVQAFAEKQMRYTTLAHDVVEIGASQISTFQLHAKTIQSLLPAFQDLAVGQWGVNVSQENAIKTANLIGKVYTGQVGALRRVGISFTKAQEKILKTGTESRKTAMLISVIHQNYGNLARKMAETPEGRVLRLKNAWGEVKEEIGFRLLPLQEKTLSYLSSHLPEIQTFIVRVVRGVELWAGRLKPVWNLAYRIGSWVSKNWSVLGPIILGVAGAVTAWSVAVKVLTIAQAALNIVLTANPIGLVIVAIGALIGLVYLLVKNWEKVRAAMVRAWRWFIKFGTEGPGRFVPVIAIIALIAKNWDRIRGAIVRAWNWVVRFCTQGPGRFIPIVAAITTIVKNWDRIVDAVKRAYQWTLKYIAIASGKNAKSGLGKFARTARWFSLPGAALNLATRAGGGPVSSGRPYLVGERGPELFVPKLSGQIIPNMAAAGGGGITVNVTVNAGAGQNDIAGQIRQGTDYLVERLARIERNRMRRSFE